MKNTILLIFLFSGFVSTAQDKGAKPIVLSKGQNISVLTTNVSDADMGMGMQMKNNSVTTSVIAVTGENEKEYTLTNTLTKMKATIDAMGKTHEYDSDKASDKDSEMGKALSDAIGKPLAVTLNKTFGTAIYDIKNAGPEKPEANPMDDMLKAFGTGGSDPSVAGAFFLIPTGKKAGDSWVVTDSTKDKKEIKTYKINSIANNVATVSFQSVTDASSTVELQGNQMDITLNTKSSGEIITDIKTGLVNNRVMDSDISGTMEIMGQSLPVSAKSKLVSVYTLAK